MIRKLIFFFAVAAVGCGLCALLIHLPWLRLACIGLVILVCALYFVISPPGTGHVNENSLSSIIACILIVFVGCSGERIAAKKARSAGQSGPANGSETNQTSSAAGSGR
jgi:hypothetical protein